MNALSSLFFAALCLSITSVGFAQPSEYTSAKTALLNLPVVNSNLTLKTKINDFIQAWETHALGSETNLQMQIVGLHNSSPPSNIRSRIENGVYKSRAKQLRNLASILSNRPLGQSTSGGNWNAWESDDGEYKLHERNGNHWHLDANGVDYLLLKSSGNANPMLFSCALLSGKTIKIDHANKKAQLFVGNTGRPGEWKSESIPTHRTFMEFGLSGAHYEKNLGDIWVKRASNGTIVEKYRGQEQADCLILKIDPAPSHYYAQYAPHGYKIYKNGHEPADGKGKLRPIKSDGTEIPNHSDIKDGVWKQN